MNKKIRNALLQDPRVVEEIQRHLWLESEKAGYDVGFQAASEDWFKKFAKAWMDYHMPHAKLPSEKKTPPRRKVLAKAIA